jgi:hypothetical protein
VEPSDYVAYLGFLFQQVKLQQEVRDRWFRYYMTIAGAILGTGIAIAKFFYSSKFNQGLCLLLLALSTTMGLIGICFFMIYLRQRSNYIQQYKAITKVEDKLFSIKEWAEAHIVSPVDSKQDHTAWTESFLAIRSHSIKKYGADFFTIWIHIITNSVYFCSSFVFLTMLLKGKTSLSLLDLGLTGLFFVLVAAWFEIVRRRNFY